MSRHYSLSEELHQYLNGKAVALTIALNRPVATRHVLDAILNLQKTGVVIDDNTLRMQVEQKLKAPRGGQRN